MNLKINIEIIFCDIKDLFFSLYLELEDSDEEILFSVKC